MTILIIDDSLEIRENTVELLQLEGYSTLEAMNGRKGLEMAMEHVPDIILCDIMMPEINGYQVLEELKKNTSTASIPFLFLSANVEKKDIEAGLKMGASGYIRKPFEIEELLSEIEQFIKR